MRKLFLAVLALLFAFSSGAQTISVQAHKVVAEDESFNITFIIDGEEKVTDFKWEPGDDFQLLWGPQKGQSTSIQIINGKRSKTVKSTYTFLLKPVKIGKFTLNRAVATIGGKNITSKAVSIEVVGSQSASVSSQSSPQGQEDSQNSSEKSTSSAKSTKSGPDIFLSLSVSDANVVIGEPLTATIRIYTRVDVAGFENVQFPTFNGFWSQEQASPTNIEFSRTSYNGQIYSAALLKKYILIPQQQGTLTIDPAELVCLVNQRTQSSGSSFFDEVFGTVTTVRKKLVSRAVNVKVSALPEGAPASFGGGVGKFNISAKMSKDSLKMHEAASLIVSVSGKGNISLIQTPKVKLPAEMEAYDTKISDKVSKGGYSGTKTYEFPFIPRSYGDYVINPITYSYYDVETGKYATIQTDSIKFNVARADDSDDAGVIVSAPIKSDVKSLADDIRYINVKKSSLSKVGEFFVGSSLFWNLIAFFLIIAVGCWFAFNKIARRRADIVGTKNRKATKMAMKRLRVAGGFLQQNLHTAFYEELHKALLGFISDKLNVPLAELSKERIAEIMTKGGVPQSLTESFVGLLDACEFARYSPSSGNEAMAAHYSSALDVISSIDSNMKTVRSSFNTVSMITLLLALLPMASYAQTDNVDSLWNSANTAYSQGAWEEAIKDYQSIADASMESAPLWCNMGSAWYKNGYIGKAILCYERALKLDPSYEDARYNLQLMNSLKRDRIESVPEMILVTWTKSLSRLLDSNSWAVCFMVFFVLSLAMILLFLLGSSISSRRTGFFTAIVFVIFAASSLAFSLWQKAECEKTDSAVVMKPVSSVKSSPSSDSAKDLFVLHEGTKVMLIDNVGSWSNIELADGRQGWVPSSDLEII